MKLKREEVEKLLLAEKVKLRMSLKEIKALLADLDKDGKIDPDELLQKVGGGPKPFMTFKLKAAGQGLDQRGRLVSTSSTEDLNSIEILFGFEPREMEADSGTNGTF